MQWDCFRYGGSHVESGLKNSCAISRPELFKVSKIGTVLFESTVLPTTAEIDETDSFKAEKLDIVRGASQLTTNNGLHLAELVDKGWFHREGRHSKAFAILKARFKGRACLDAAFMVLYSTGLHVFQVAALLAQEGEPAGSEITDVSSWSLHSKTVTAVHARSQPAADAGGSVWENGQGW
jgi:hypothetical protein